MPTGLTQLWQQSPDMCKKNPLAAGQKDLSSRTSVGSHAHLATASGAKLLEQKQMAEEFQVNAANDF